MNPAPSKRWRDKIAAEMERAARALAEHRLTTPSDHPGNPSDPDAPRLLFGSPACYFIHADPDALRTVAAKLRRPEPAPERCPKVRSTVCPSEGARQARQLYGDRAADTLARQLRTLDPEDYPEPTWSAWIGTLGELLKTEPRPEP